MTVVTHNIGDTHERTVPVDRIAAAYGDLPAPDLVLLQEVASEGRLIALRRALEGMTGRGYDYAYSRSIGTGMLAAGRIDARRTFVAPSSQISYGAFAATVTIGGATLDAVNVHLDPVLKTRDRHGWSVASTLVVQLIAEAVLPTVRSRMVAEIVEWVSEWSTNPVVIGGDFNTVPQSTALRAMRRVYRDAAAGTPAARSGTYWKIRGPEPRIDFLFHSEHVEARDVRVVRHRAGDHYPVAATLGFSATSAPQHEARGGAGEASGRR